MTTDRGTGPPAPTALACPVTHPALLRASLQSSASRSVNPHRLLWLLMTRPTRPPLPRAHKDDLLISPRLCAAARPLGSSRTADPRRCTCGAPIRAWISMLPGGAGGGRATSAHTRHIREELQLLHSLRDPPLQRRAPAGQPRPSEDSHLHTASQRGSRGTASSMADPEAAPRPRPRRGGATEVHVSANKARPAGLGAPDSRIHNPHSQLGSSGCSLNLMPLSGPRDGTDAAGSEVTPPGPSAA